MSKKTKYTLFSTEGDGPRPCAFFSSPQGCKSGANCKFMHGNTAPAVVTAPPAVSSSTSRATYAQPPIPNVKSASTSNTGKRLSDADDNSPFIPVEKVKKQRISEEYVQPPQETAPSETAVLVPRAIVTNGNNNSNSEVKKQKAAFDLEEFKRKQEEKHTRQKQEKKERLKRLSVPGAIVNFGKPQVQPVTASSSKPIVMPALNNIVMPSPFQVVQPPSTSFSSGPIFHQNRPNIQGSNAPSNHGNNYNNNNNNDVESSDDDETAFLYNAVDFALQETAPSRSHAPQQQQQQQQQQHVQMEPSYRSVSIPKQTSHPPPLLPVFEAPPRLIATPAPSINNDSNSPFVPNSDIPNILATSGSYYALMGASKKNAKEPTRNPLSSSVDVPFAFPVTVSSSEVSRVTAPLSAPLQSLEFSYGDMLGLVSSTQQNKRFRTEYNFDVDATWVQPKPYGDWCKAFPQVIAIDCEMCVSQDPVTSVKDAYTLIRFSAVKGLGGTEDLLLDTLVAPALPIVESKSHIHGITEEKLRGINVTLRHVQAYLLNLCSDKTIIVGHAVYHDLKTLRFAHNLVVDTSYLYFLQNETGCPSIRDISEQIFAVKLPETHDSVIDAQAALKAAVYVAKQGGAPLITRANNDKNLDSLLCHKVPQACTEESLKQMFAENTFIIPVKVCPIERGTNGATGKATVIFASALHANLAFDSISGPVRQEKNNKDQKRVYLKGGGYMCIRKY